MSLCTAPILRLSRRSVAPRQGRSCVASLRDGCATLDTAPPTARDGQDQGRAGKTGQGRVLVAGLLQPVGAGGLGGWLGSGGRAAVLVVWVLVPALGGWSGSAGGLRLVVVVRRGLGGWCLAPGAGAAHAGVFGGVACVRVGSRFCVVRVCLVGV